MSEYAPELDVKTRVRVLGAQIGMRAGELAVPGYRPGATIMLGFLARDTTTRRIVPVRAVYGPEVLPDGMRAQVLRVGIGTRRDAYVLPEYGVCMHGWGNFSPADLDRKQPAGLPNYNEGDLAAEAMQATMQWYLGQMTDSTLLQVSSKPL